MRVVLRLFALGIVTVVILTVILIVRIVQVGTLGALGRAGTLGILTFVGWGITLLVGPFAAVQLWRLRRAGLIAAAGMASFALLYSLAGIMFLRAPEASAKPILVSILMNGAVLAILLSPRARVICSSPSDRWQSPKPN